MDPILENQNIQSITIEDEIKRSYISYAMSVILGRAIPDARDGLKPVHRRVLYCMYENNNTHSLPYKKSAKITGSTMGAYHPHGDMAIYDSIVRMAQDFSMRYTLIDGHGNFGSIDADAPAAARYTEIRLDKLTDHLLFDLDKETVPWSPNYDDSTVEPDVLPTRVLNLLLNGSEGIAVGMSTKIPPHNLLEINNALIALIKDPTITFDDLLIHIPGPDFPTGGSIYGTENIALAYKTGRGIIQVRGKLHVESGQRGNKENIIITEIPYQVNKAKLIEKIVELLKDKKIEGISDIRDESNREGIRVVIELKKDVQSSYIITQLYKLTQLQTSFGIILLAIVDGRPKILNLREILDQFITFRREVIYKRSIFDISKLTRRLDIVDGFITALSNVNKVIETIRQSKDTETAKNNLLAINFNGVQLNETQVKSILDLKLSRLTSLEINKFTSEKEELNHQILELEKLTKDQAIFITDPVTEDVYIKMPNIDQIIIKELQEISEKFSDARRTEIVYETAEIASEDLIKKEDVVITISHTGYIKRSSASLYRSQKRGGKGKQSMAMKEEDFVSDIFHASTHDYFLIFTSKGKVFRKKVYEIPSTNLNTKGKAIINLVPLSDGEKVAACMPISTFTSDTNQFLFFATKHGIVKKSELTLYDNNRTNGMIAITLDEEDELVSVKKCEDSDYIFLGTVNGLSIRFNANEVRSIGRSGMGVKGISLKNKDRVVGMEVFKDEAQSVLTICENGYGKRTVLSEYRDQKRAGSGVKTINVSERNGKVIGFASVNDNDAIIVVTTKGKVIKTNCDQMRVIGRTTQGVRIINAEEDDFVVAIAKTQKEEVIPEVISVEEIEEVPSDETIAQ